MYFLEDFASDGVIRSTCAIFIFPSDFSSPTVLSLPALYSDLTFYLFAHLISTKSASPSQIFGEVPICFGVSDWVFLGLFVCVLILLCVCLFWGAGVLN